jgi:hypothetical protein
VKDQITSAEHNPAAYRLIRRDAIKTASFLVAILSPEPLTLPRCR